MVYSEKNSFVQKKAQNREKPLVVTTNSMQKCGKIPIFKSGKCTFSKIWVMPLKEGIVILEVNKIFFFQMNYSTGEWKRIKKYRRLEEEVIFTKGAR